MKLKLSLLLNALLCICLLTLKLKHGVSLLLVGSLYASPSMANTTSTLSSLPGMHDAHVTMVTPIHVVDGKKLKAVEHI